MATRAEHVDQVEMVKMFCIVDKIISTGGCVVCLLVIISMYAGLGRYEHHK